MGVGGFFAGELGLVGNETDEGDLMAVGDLIIIGDFERAFLDGEDVDDEEDGDKGDFSRDADDEEDEDEDEGVVGVFGVVGIFRSGEFIGSNVDVVVGEDGIAVVVSLRIGEMGVAVR